MVVSNLVVCDYYVEGLFLALLRPFLRSLLTCVCALLWTFALLPNLLFLVFFSRTKGKENLQKNKHFSSLPNPKISGKEGKNTQKNKEFLAKETCKESQKSKEKQIRAFALICMFLRLTAFRTTAFGKCSPGFRPKNLLFGLTVRLQPLLFSFSLLLSLLRGPLLFSLFGMFAFSSKDFGGSAKRRTLASGAKKRGVFEGGFCKMYASLGCRALSAQMYCWGQYPWVFCFLGRDT